MTWQEGVFLVGGLCSVIILAPTLRNSDSRVPRTTSLPIAIRSIIYTLTFYTLNMPSSAIGAALGTAMWVLICTFRAPSDSPTPSRGRTFWHEIRAASRAVPFLRGVR